MYNMAHTSNLSELSNNSNSELVVNKIECNETMVNISSLNQGAVTQQNLGNLNKDSKDKFDMNAISIMSTEVHEKVEVQQHATPVSNDNEIHNYTHHVEKMNDDNINNETTEAEIEKRGIRIRSKDTSLSSKYAKEYASMCEEFCCFNYIPPLKSISHFVFHNDFSSLARLIENQLGTDGFDLNQRDETGETASWTPLYWSVKLNKIDFVKYLLEQGADVNIVINDYDECCGTALDLAMLRGYEVMEKILKEHMEKDSNNTAQKGFKNIRTKPRGKAPAFNFKYYGKKKRECQFSDSDESMGSPDYTLNK